MVSVTPNHLCVCFCITLPLQGINHEGLNQSLNQSKSNNDRKDGHVAERSRWQGLPDVVSGHGS